ncbi:MAG: carbon monoxide dehydrogenase, partial [Candidatus Omnitrophota bacterium]
KNLIEHLVLRRGEDVVMDMEAGVEHFGRGTAQSCDSVLVVVEPSRKSVESAKRIVKLAKDLGIKNIFAIANKVRTVNDKKFIEESLAPDLDVIEVIPFSQAILETDRSGKIVNVGQDILDKVKAIDIFLSERIGG